MPLGQIILISMLGSLLASCATRQSFDTRKEHGPTAAADTRLARAIEPLREEHPGLSGIYLLPDGEDAFLARLAAIELAEVSIVAQYYIFKNDVTGRLFLERLLIAADRGVRVRLIVDDLAKTWKDSYLVKASAHPNFEIQLFNPLTRIGSIRPMRAITQFKAMHRRMHNKELVVDGQLAVVGGRNIANEYFEAGDDNVTDLDAIVVGPVVAELMEIFENYWEYGLSSPVERVALKKRVSNEERQEFRASLTEWNGSKDALAYRARLMQRPFLNSIKGRGIPFYWGQASAHADRPEKLDRTRFVKDAHLTPSLAPYAKLAENELILISPYFIPGKRGSEELKSISEKGANVVVVTNSLESNDHPLVHAAYMKYRKRLLASGVQLLETKAAADRKTDGRELADFEGSSLLHTKLFIVDRRYVMIGSLNLDPRSRLLNTELMLVHDSPKLAEEIVARYKINLDGRFWKLGLDENERVVWTDVVEEPNELVRSEPGVSFFDRVKLRLLSLLPIEAQL